VVTLNHIVILGLLNHLNLVNASFAISSSLGSSNGAKTDISASSSSTLTVNPSRQSNSWGKSVIVGMIMSMSMIMIIGFALCSSIEGEGVEKGALIPRNLGRVASEAASSLA
jgi:hypothetical protein